MSERVDVKAPSWKSPDAASSSRSIPADPSKSEEWSKKLNAASQRQQEKDKLAAAESNADEHLAAFMQNGGDLAVVDMAALLAAYGLKEGDVDLLLKSGNNDALNELLQQHGLLSSLSDADSDADLARLKANLMNALLSAEQVADKEKASLLNMGNLGDRILSNSTGTLSNSQAASSAQTVSDVDKLYAMIEKVYKVGAEGRLMQLNNAALPQTQLSLNLTSTGALQVAFVTTSNYSKQMIERNQQKLLEKLKERYDVASINIVTDGDDVKNLVESGGHV